MLASAGPPTLLTPVCCVGSACVCFDQGPPSPPGPPGDPGCYTPGFYWPGDGDKCVKCPKLPCKQGEKQDGICGLDYSDLHCRSVVLPLARFAS